MFDEDELKVYDKKFQAIGILDKEEQKKKQEEEKKKKEEDAKPKEEGN